MMMLAHLISWVSGLFMPHEQLINNVGNCSWHLGVFWSVCGLSYVSVSVLWVSCYIRDGLNYACFSVIETICSSWVSMMKPVLVSGT